MTSMERSIDPRSDIVTGARLTQITQPRFLQNRTVLEQKLATAPPYPQIVDPACIKAGDKLRVIDAFEGFVRMELMVITGIIAVIDQRRIESAYLDAVVTGNANDTSPYQPGRHSLPAAVIGIPSLTLEGDLGRSDASDYISYSHLFLVEKN